MDHIERVLAKTRHGDAGDHLSLTVQLDKVVNDPYGS